MPGLLITRPHAQAQETAARLSAAGWRCLFAPLLTIEALDWTLPPAPPQAVLLTSGNAVEALAASGLARALPVYAVGARTAARVREQGFAHVYSAEGDAAALVALVTQQCAPGLGALLHLSGDVVAGQLAARLSAVGFWVEQRIVYRALPQKTLPEEVHRALVAGEVVGVLLYSPRSAAILARLLVQPSARAALSLYCLSPAIAAAAGPGWRSVLSAPHPDENSLLEILPTV